jgi:hypothetical protein
MVRLVLPVLPALTRRYPAPPVLLALLVSTALLGQLAPLALMARLARSE